MLKLAVPVLLAGGLSAGGAASAAVDEDRLAAAEEAALNGWEAALAENGVDGESPACGFTSLNADDGSYLFTCYAVDDGVWLSPVSVDSDGDVDVLWLLHYGLDSGTTGEARDEGDEGDEGEERETYGAGTYLVGEDLQPGTYRTDGPDPGDIWPLCYWARLSGLSGEFSDIIANDNVEGQAFVEVQQSDVAIEFGSGCTWTRAD